MSFDVVYIVKINTNRNTDELRYMRQMTSEQEGRSHRPESTVYVKLDNEEGQEVKVETNGSWSISYEFTDSDYVALITTSKNETNSDELGFTFMVEDETPSTFVRTKGNNIYHPVGKTWNENDYGYTTEEKGVYL